MSCLRAALTLCCPPVAPIGTITNSSNELIPKAEAEQMLKQLIKANKKGGVANQVAVALLDIVLQDVSAFQPATRQ